MRPSLRPWLICIKPLCLRRLINGEFQHLEAWATWLCVWMGERSIPTKSVKYGLVISLSRESNCRLCPVKVLFYLTHHGLTILERLIAVSVKSSLSRDEEDMGESRREGFFKFMTKHLADFNTLDEATAATNDLP